MSVTDPSFGVVTACYPDDYALVTATCASIRYFLPDVPIAVIADKDVCVDELVRVYGVTVLRTNPYIQSFPIPLSGNYFVKWIAFLDAPFARFLYLDSDAIIWGNILSQLQLEDHEFMSLNTYGVIPPKSMNKWWFDPDRLRDIDPSFDATGCPLFCAGSFAARKSLLSRKEIHELLAFYRQHESAFRFGDQGLFNYAVFRKQQRGEINVSAANLQIPAPDLSDEEFERRFFIEQLQMNEISEPAVLHFCGKKPLIQYRMPKVRLFTWFRHQFFKDLGLSLSAAWKRTLYEEAIHLKRRAQRKLRARLQSTVTLFDF